MPVPIYNALFFEQVLILLQGKCAYCHHLKLAPKEVHRYACKLQLLRFGFVNEAQEIDAMSKGTESMDSDDEEGESKDLASDLIERRELYVDRVLRGADGKHQVLASMIEKVAGLSGERRRVIKAFLKDIQKPKACVSCNGYA